MFLKSFLMNSEPNAGGGGGNGPAAPVAPLSGSPAGSPAPSSSAPTSWTDGLNDDFKSYVQTKGFKEPRDVLESYRNFEKLQGVPRERLLQLPENTESEEMKAVWQRLGAPKEAKDYKIEFPKEFKDDGLVEWAQKSFHELNMPKNMAEKFMEKFVVRQKDLLKNVLDSRVQKHELDRNELKKDWGQAYDQNESIANRAALKFGLSTEDISALGHAMGPKKTLELLYKVGQGLGEVPYVTGGNAGGNGHLTPAQAQSEIETLKRDRSFADKMREGSAEARAKWDRLHQYAYPGEMTI